jgi:hypothetical protein
VKTIIHEKLRASGDAQQSPEPGAEG